MINNIKFNEAIADFAGTKNQLKVFVYLVNWDNYCVEAHNIHFEHFQTSIAEELNIKSDRIRNDISYLVDNGYIEVSDGDSVAKGNKSKVFEVLNGVVFKGENDSNRLRPKMGPNIKTQDGSYNKDINKKEINNNTYNISTLYKECEMTTQDGSKYQDEQMEEVNNPNLDLGIVECTMVDVDYNDSDIPIEEVEESASNDNIQMEEVYDSDSIHNTKRIVMEIKQGIDAGVFITRQHLSQRLSFEAQIGGYIDTLMEYYDYKYPNGRVDNDDDSAYDTNDDIQERA